MTEESLREYAVASRLSFFGPNILPPDITDEVRDFLTLSDVNLDDKSFRAIVTSNIIKANRTLVSAEKSAAAAAPGMIVLMKMLF